MQVDEKKIFSKIAGKYNLDFLNNLTKIEGLKIYAFGGMIRDFYLNREWKEVDMRIVFNKERRDREVLIEEALQEYGLQGKTQIENLNLTVYRFLPAGSQTSEPIDLSLVPTRQDNLPDFTINSIFFDLNDHQILDQYDGVGDLKNKIIRTVKPPFIQFQEEPHMMFRAIKFACQLGFTIEDETNRAIKELSNLAHKTFSFISESKKGIFVELFLANIFKGLKSDPEKYFEYLKELGLYDEMVIYTSTKLGLSIKEIIYPVKNQEGFEDNLSYLFSCIVDSLSETDKADQFTFITTDLAITTLKEYSDFIVDTSKIKYSKI